MIKHTFNERGDMLIYKEDQLVFTLCLKDAKLLDVANKLSITTKDIQKYILNYLGINALVINK